MGTQKEVVRVVLDTNVLVSVLLFQQSRLGWIRAEWMAGRFTPLVDKPCTDELLRVLTYPKFGLTKHDIETVLSEYLPYTKTVHSLPRGARGLPKCRDPHDQKFLALAEIGRADMLVTGDRALLDLEGRTRFAIIEPSVFREQLKRGQ